MSVAAPLSPIDRRALRAVAIQFFVNGVLSSSFIARLPAIRDRAGISVAALGLVLTAGGVAALVGSLSAGSIVHRGGTLRVLGAGAIVLPLLLPVIGATTTVWVLAPALCLYAFFDVLVDISMNMQGSWISARRSVPVMSRLHGLWSLGAVTGGLIAAQAAARGVSLVAHLTAVAVVVACLLIVVTRGLLRTDEEVHADMVDLPDDVPPLRARRIALAMLALAGASAFVMESTAADWSTFRLTDDFDAPDGLASLAYVSFFVGMSVMRLAGDSVQVALGRARLHTASLAAATVGLITASFAPVEGVVIAGFLVAGFGIATFLPRLYDDAARRRGRRGAGLGALSGGMRAASLVAPTLVGALAATSLSVGATIAIVTLPAAAVFLFAAA